MPDNRPLRPVLDSMKKWANQHLRENRPPPIPSAIWKHREKMLGLLSLFVTPYLAYLVVTQGRFWSLVYGYGAFVAVVMVIAFAAELAPVAFPVIGYSVWHYLASSPHIQTDLLVGGATVLLLNCYFWSAPGQSHWGNSRLAVVVFGSFVSLLTWATISVSDAVSSRRPPGLNPAAYLSARQASPWKNAQIGLALSGGGYRAALYHAGVLDALEFLRAAPTHLSTVSGGSIIGAYYSLGGRPDQFRALVTERQFGIKRRATTLGQAARLVFCPGRIPGAGLRLIPGCDYGRSDVQAGLLDDVLLGGAKLGQPPLAGMPKLVIAGTELNLGGIVGLTHEGILRIRPTGIELKYPFVNGPRAAFASASLSGSPNGWDGVRLSEAVAASGAFPIAFNPVKIQYAGQPLQIVDGGVADNSGLTLLLGASQMLRWPLHVVLVSDGSRALEAHDERLANGEAQDEGATEMRGVSRALDILANSTMLPPDIASSYPERLILLSPNPLIRWADRPEHQHEVLAAQWKRAIGSPHNVDGRIEKVLDSWQTEFALAVAASGGDKNKVAFHREAGVGAVMRALARFAVAPTLQDEYPPLEALQLYQLGRYIVALNWPDIAEALNRPLTAPLSAGAHDRASAVQ